MTTGSGAALAALDDDRQAALARASRAFITHPRLQRLHRLVERNQHLSRLAGEPQCMTLEGPLGAGKTSFVKRYAAAFPRQEDDEGARVPVFYLETPSPVTIKGAALNMLQALGDPAAHYVPLYAVDRRLVTLLRGCRTTLVILDDFHHLIARGRRRVAVDVADWLKVLIKESGVMFLVVGLEGTIDEIMHANRQLSRLFAARETLAPFAWEPGDPQAVREFADFVRCAERAVELPLAPDLPRGDLLGLLHAATDGVVANLMNLLRACQADVLERGGAAITRDDLARNYRRRLAKHLGRPGNPFGDAADG